MPTQISVRNFFEECRARAHTSNEDRLLKEHQNLAQFRARLLAALDQDELEKAEALLIASLPVSSNLPTSYRDLARIYYRTGDYEKALQYAHLWAKENPKSIKPQILLARLFKVMAQLSELDEIGPALASVKDAEAAQEVLRLFPHYPELRTAALATLQTLLHEAVTSHDEVLTRRILGTLSRLANEETFLAAHKFAVSSGLPGTKEVYAKHLIRKGRYSEALGVLQKYDAAPTANAELNRLLNFVLDLYPESAGVPQNSRPAASREDSPLVDALKAAEVGEFVVFHTDHFEPWGGHFAEWQLGRCETFANRIARHDYTRKLSLFYRPETPFSLSFGGDPCSPGLSAFGVVAPGRPVNEQSRITEVMAALGEETGTEFHLHLHHEDLMPCVESWGPTSSAVAKSVPKRHHKDLLELHVRANLHQLRLDTGAYLAKWAVIHGKWALNGSDRNVCAIDDEISRLAMLGCWGDFTFPAGRRHCTPRWRVPFSLRASNAAKAYDRLNADVRLLGETTRDMFWEQGRFFIWSMPTPYNAVSLDGSLDSTTEFCGIAHSLRSWISSGIRFDGALIIKTHAHSMAGDHHEGSGPVFPHFSPRNQRLFSTLERICERADVSLKYETVNEVKLRLDTETHD